MNEIYIRLAGCCLLMICLANGFAFKKLGWNRNLDRTEVFFQQVFKVHTLFIVLTMTAMGLGCLIAPDELNTAETVITRGFLWFGAIFWTVRVVLHLFYYDQKVKKENPWWNALFLSVFIYLAATFITLALK